VYALHYPQQAGPNTCALSAISVNALKDIMPCNA
jgi:hypothetical protein